MDGMFLGMGFFWLIPISIIGIFVWLLVTILKDESGKHEK